MAFSDAFNNDKESYILEKIVDGMYFSTTTVSTSGYGDILPVTTWSKVFVIVQHILLISLVVESPTIVAMIIVMCVVNGFLLAITDGFSNNHQVSVSEKALDGVYFTTTTISSVGYGDITPTKWWSKCVVIVQQIIMYLSIEAFNVYIHKFIVN